MKFRTIIVGIIFYCLMAFAGPAAMIWTGPVDLFATKVFYNAIQIAINSYLLMQALMLVIFLLFIRYPPQH